MSRFYITTPIYYINAEPHLGHAYTTMIADAVARAHRLSGDEVFFLTGTDEHGQKVARAAAKAGRLPNDFANEYARTFQDLLPLIGVTNDDFIRTTEPRHYRAAQELWRRVRDNGWIYKDKYEEWHCTVDEVFVPETQLQDGKCPTCGNAVERIAEESYFFKLSAFQEPLLQHFRKHPDFVTPATRRNEVVSFIEAGLDDLSVSRASLKWGIPVPDDPGHVMYVWFDALTNYMTAVGYGDPAGADRFANYWPVDVHLIGKEIVRQHALYWPAILMAAGLPLPRQIVSHGWWLMDGAKMSKSLGNVVRPKDYIDRFGLDGFRYFVMREMVFGHDASFNDEAILGRYNADLANDFGNLVSRATTMVHRYREGKVPTADAALLARQEESALGEQLDRLIQTVPAAVRRFELHQALRDIWDAVGAVNRYIVTREPWALAKDPAKAVDLDASLYVAGDAVRVIAELLRPFIPTSAERTLGMLGVQPAPAAWATLRRGELKPGSTFGTTSPLFPRIEQTVEQLRGGQLSTGSASGTAERESLRSSARGSGATDTSEKSGPQVTAEAESLRSRPRDSEAAAARGGGAPRGVNKETTVSDLPLPPDAPSPGARPDPSAPAAPAAGVGDRISFDDFMKVELRVAKVLAAERVPKSNRLLKLSVDVGTEQRTIVAGIAEAYEPEAIVGRTVVIVFNLKPAKLMGVESNGMVLAASPDGGKPMLVSFEEAPAPGTRVR